MLNTATEGLVTIVSLFVAVAVVALLVSKKAQTPQVLQSLFSGIGNNIAVAQAPVTGANVPITLAYPAAPMSVSGFSGGGGYPQF